MKQKSKRKLKCRKRGQEKNSLALKQAQVRTHAVIIALGSVDLHRSS